MTLYIIIYAVGLAFTAFNTGLNLVLAHVVNNGWSYGQYRDKAIFYGGATILLILMGLLLWLL
jgi:hypothetical protein